MEALSAASSIVAVVSIALQLANNVQRLIDFWDSVKDAPTEVTEIRSQLRILGALLSSIESEASHSPNDDGSSLADDCLLVCKESIAKLEKLSKAWDRELNRNGARRKWACLRKALREKELARYWSELERAKSTLIMYQCFMNGQRQDSLQRLMTQMIPRPHRNHFQQLSTTHTAASDISRTINRRFKKMHLGTTTYELRLSFGTIRVRFVKESVIDKLAQMEMIKRLSHLKIVATFLPKITSWRILECTFNHRYSSIDAGLQTFNLRPWSSPVFELAFHGDLHGMKRLIMEGFASPNDSDPDGWSVLHCAAATHQASMCQMLLNLGAVPNPVTKYQETPLHLATQSNCPNFELRPRHNESASLETVRVLVEQANNDPMQSNDIGRTPIFSASEGCTSESLAWLMNQDEFELDHKYKTSGGLTAAALMAQREDLSDALFWPLLRGGVVADAHCAASWAPRFKSGIKFEKPSMIQCTVWTWYDKLLDSYDQNPWHPDSLKKTRLVSSPLATMKTLLTNGVDFYCNASLVQTLLTGMVLNIVQFDGEERPLEVTRACMSTWLELVQELGFDLKTYLRTEAKKQEGRYYDIGTGIRVVVCFDEDTIPHIWTVFQGPQERERGVVVDRISQCANWRERQWFFSLRKPQHLPKVYEILQQSAEIILLKHRDRPLFDARAKCCGGSSKGGVDATELPQTTQNLRSLLFSTNPSRKRRIISTMVCHLISACRYRYEFTFYIFLLACFFGCSYLARLWIAGGFFLTFKILQDTISYWV